MRLSAKMGAISPVTIRPMVSGASWVLTPRSDVLLPQGRNPPLRSPARAERLPRLDCVNEPGDGVLQVVVLQMNLKRAGFGDPARRRRLLQIDVERRDGLAAFGPAPR